MTLTDIHVSSCSTIIYGWTLFTLSLSLYFIAPVLLFYLIYCFIVTLFIVFLLH